MTGYRDSNNGSSVVRQTVMVKYTFIHAQHTSQALRMLCQVMKVSRSGQHGRASQKPSSVAWANALLLNAIPDYRIRSGWLCHPIQQLAKELDVARCQCPWVKTLAGLARPPAGLAILGVVIE